MKQRLYFGIPGGWRKVLQVVDDRIGFFERKKYHKMWKIGQKTEFFEFIKKFKWMFILFAVFRRKLGQNALCQTAVFWNLAISLEPIDEITCHWMLIEINKS